MTLLIILACVFGVVALMVILGERFGKPMSEEQQAKFSKVSWILVFVLLLAAIVKELI
jgi:amino acid permease